MTKLTEAQLATGDVKAIFKAAEKYRDTSHLASWDRYKEDISVADLQQAWKDAGYPDDTHDIESILRDKGFGRREIKKVFKNVLGDTADEGTSPAVMKIVDIIKKEGVVDEVVAFLEKNFADEVNPRGGVAGMFDKIKKRFTTEDIRTIFTTIVNEERTERETLLKQHETQQFGRKRK